MFLKRTDFITRRQGNLYIFLRNHTDSALIHKENSNFGWLSETLKLKTENQSKLTLNSILGNLHEKVAVFCLLQVILNDLAYFSNFKVSETGVVLPHFVVNCLSSTLCKFSMKISFWQSFNLSQPLPLPAWLTFIAWCLVRRAGAGSQETWCL